MTIRASPAATRTVSPPVRARRGIATPPRSSPLPPLSPLDLPGGGEGVGSHRRSVSARSADLGHEGQCHEPRRCGGQSAAGGAPGTGEVSEGNGILLGTEWHWPRRKAHAEKLEWGSGFGLEPLLKAARMIWEHL